MDQRIRAVFDDEDTLQREGDLPVWIEGDSLAPYLPSTVDGTLATLRFAQIDAQSVVFDLGCGDGRIVTIASAVYGCERGGGIDIEPECIERARRAAQALQVDARVHFAAGDLLGDLLERVDGGETVDASLAAVLDAFRAATVIVVYLLPDCFEALCAVLARQRAHLRAGVRIVVRRWRLPAPWTPTRVDADAGLYEYRLDSERT